jgi:hypothetical protein
MGITLYMSGSSAPTLVSPHTNAIAGFSGSVTVPGDTGYDDARSQWTDADPAVARREIAWVRDTFAALSPHLTGGACANFMDDDEPDPAGRAYGETLARLSQVKARYDPENVCSLNQNVAPAR